MSITRKRKSGSFARQSGRQGRPAELSRESGREWSVEWSKE